MHRTDAAIIDTLPGIPSRGPPVSRSLFARLHDRFERPRQLSREGLSRREFLARLAAASAAGISLPALATDPKRPREGAIGNVLVLGAGLAGLSCSLELCKA
ncbi:MAG: hypothetical protein ACK58T_30100, partial [Phycisphaerae bacterium]